MYLPEQERVAFSLPYRQGARLVTALALLILWLPIHGLAWGDKVKLTRRYRRGQKMVYATNMNTKAVIHSEPPGLQDLLPPLPTSFTMQQQNTVTVKEVYDDGSADIENHFDKFVFQSDLADRMPENLRNPAVAAQQEISERIAGQTIVVHYDRNGQLLRFEGGEGLFSQLDLAHREPLRQALRFFLQQVGGDALYPDHAVKPGETWKRKFESKPSAAFPFNVEGESTLRYIGKTKLGGVKAAVVSFSFVNASTPAPEALGKADPLVQLESHGLGVEMRVEGQGSGQVLLALDDGRVLENHATVHQALSAHLKSGAPLALLKSPVKFEMQSDSEMEVQGSGK